MTSSGRGAGGGARRFREAFDGDRAEIPPERRARTLRRTVGFFVPYRRKVAVVFVAILATSLLGLVNPLILKLLIDDAIPSLDFGKLNLYVGLMVGIPIVSGLIGVGQSYLNNVIGQGVMQDLRAALYAHLQRMPLRFFAETRTGEIQSRLANDVGGIQRVVTDAASSITSNVVVSVSTVLAMFVLDWRLTLLSLALLPFFMYLTFRVGNIRRQISAATQRSLADLSAVTEETLSVSGILLSKTFGQQSNAVRRYGELAGRLARLQVRQAMVGRWFFMTVGTIFTITPAFVYWLAGWLAVQGDPSAPSIGDIVAFTTLQSRLFFPLGQLLNFQADYLSALALFDRIFEYLDLRPGIVDAPDAVAIDHARTRGQVRFRDVTFHYPSRPILESTQVVAGGRSDREEPAAGRPAAEAIGRRTAADVARAEAEIEGPAAAPEPATVPARAAEAVEETVIVAAVGRDGDAGAYGAAGARGEGGRDGDAEPPRPFALEGIDFVAEPGELVALVGPSGSGKTTTTYLIPRLYDVDAGAVEIDGRDVRTIRLESLGAVIGFVTQETYLFHASIRENLQYARPDASDAELTAAARAAAIHDRIMELPEGYDTVVGERGYKLSGGEKQRVAIARVLLKDPRILILDEATSALDTVSERLIQAAIEQLLVGRTTIAIAHRLSTILRADRILVFERGRIVERGTHAELLALDGVYARLYREQFLAETSPDASAAPAAAGSAPAATGSAPAAAGSAATLGTTPAARETATLGESGSFGGARRGR
jgi:ATP-binding cassette subfamily B protein